MQRFRSIERDSVELALSDGRTVVVTRVRDPRARRLKLCVDERGARLTMPPRASAISGKRFLEENRDWLAMQLARYATDAVLPLQPGVTEALPLRAQLLPLRWSEGRYTRLRRDDDGGLVFSITSRATAATLSRALRDYYEGEARADLGRWLPRYLPTLPRPPRRVRFKVMSSQWGSLAPDDGVALDLSLVLARPSAFEYVLVHELCHLLQPDHSRAFWQEVEARFPDWRDERDWFHAHGRQVKASLRTLLG
ncbi:MAG TPA: SprT family zinc-dependent metalloprotease [Luteimonas sp.]|nr:SprT family zinc-dependent metalloprotease [Luteimonas sp.]